MARTDFPTMTLRLFGLSLWLTALAACGSGSTPRCSYGEIVECACLGGSSSLQACQQDGTFGACACGTGDTTDAGTNADGATRSDTGPGAPPCTPTMSGEICGNVLDDNCNGQVDEGCPLPPALLELGDGTTCNGDANGTVRCWGRDDHSQLGDGYASRGRTPTVIPELQGAVQIALGHAHGHGCARFVDGSVKCWGDNGDCQLGECEHCGTHCDSDEQAGYWGGDPWPTPRRVGELTGVVQLAAGYGVTCALDVAGSVSCWGFDGYGGLGNGVPPGPDNIIYFDIHPIAGPIPGLTHVRAIAAGSSHVCALLEDGTVKCWGDNLRGQLGDGTSTRRLVPVPVVGLTGVVQLALGDYHSCARLVDGTVKCWGDTGYGSTGVQPGSDTTVPNEVVGLAGVEEISAGASFVCARLHDGTVKCWGDDGSVGSLGDDSNRPSDSPVAVTGLTDVVRIESGTDHTCARRADGTLWCWGGNSDGQLGGGTMGYSPVPLCAAGTCTSASP